MKIRFTFVIALLVLAATAEARNPLFGRRTTGRATPNRAMQQQATQQRVTPTSRAADHRSPAATPALLQGVMQSPEAMTKLYGPSILIRDEA